VTYCSFAPSTFLPGVLLLQHALQPTRRRHSMFADRRRLCFRPLPGGAVPRARRGATCSPGPARAGAISLACLLACARVREPLSLAGCLREPPIRGQATCELGAAPRPAKALSAGRGRCIARSPRARAPGSSRLHGVSAARVWVHGTLAPAAWAAALAYLECLDEARVAVHQRQGHMRRTAASTDLTSVAARA
jgi:hypothetical protein